MSGENSMILENIVTLETNASEEKVSPNATLIIKKYYKKCGHTTKDYATVPEEIVNKTRKRSTRDVFTVGGKGLFSQ